MSDLDRLYGRLGLRSGVGVEALRAPVASSEGPLTPSTIDELERQLDNEPLATLNMMRATWKEDASVDEVRRLLHRARAALQRPGNAAAQLDAMTDDEVLRATLPPDFEFPGKTPAIPIDPSSYKFETMRDALGWAFNAGPSWLKYGFGSSKADFRWAEDFPSGFHYPLVAGSDGKTRVALFSDFGTGLYHSRYIALHIGAARPDYAIHLGDVYYAGKEQEFADYFTSVLAPIVDGSRCFAMNGNHEMLSGGRYYFAYLDDKRGHQKTPQEQEGSYFALVGDKFQIVGVDTDYHHDRWAYGRLAEPRLNQWLHDRLREGRAAGRVNILLTGDEAWDLGKPDLKPLLSQDLAAMASEGLIDLWFWGNTHYCALYGRSGKTPFVSSCIGHGGYPYDRLADGDGAHSPTSVRFLETSARFPAATGVRQDRGNNGYVMMTLSPDGTVELQYIDWMRSLRHTATLRRNASGVLDFV